MISDTWLILGGSSSVARAFAFEVARLGADVLLAGRDMEDLARTAADLNIRTGRKATPVEFDASAADSHADFVETCRGKAERLNVFLAFGIMPSQAQTDRDFDLARAMIETNYLGAVSVLDRLAPVMEAQGQGHVVVLGSVAGDRGRLRNYLYGSTKAALHTYLEGLRARLHRSGVQVLTIKPGVLDTAMTWGLPRLPFPATPEAFARATLAHVKRGREIAYVPGIWRLIMLVIRSIPERFFKKTDI
jgi:NADP-dependent 3-hydroxy acid dehydrogenase YdfG